ncbi:MAG TPA: winged helix-turn-helix domain-containing protein [Blastocatellia bacterium]|nr:winged helix-turn-helix domain-containing protein [Blastocatellia bacterium]
MSLETNDFYEFDSFRLDPHERMLLRNGEMVQLTPKAFETLLVLIENSNRVLEKEELMKRIWPDTFVEEANLAVNISLLRKALGERPGGGQYIETVPRRGYRFVASVSRKWDEPPAVIVRERTVSRVVIEQDTEDVAGYDAHLMPMDSGQEIAPIDVRPVEAAPVLPLRQERQALAGQTARAARPSLLASIKRLRFVAALALATVAVVAGAVYLLFFKGGAGSDEPRRLAVLPFRNVRLEPDIDFLGFSLADAVITRLGYVSSLIVRPSSYVDKYRNREIDPRAVAKELNVDTLLVGSFQKEGDDLRITAQLIDVATEKMLWRDTIDLKFERLMTVQDRVSQQIIKELELSLSSTESERLARNAPQNATAYEFFLRGVNLYATNDFPQAVAMLQKSVEIDPTYDEAWAHLGRAYTANASFQFGGREHASKAQAAHERALALNPDQIEARIFMANLFTDTNRVEQAMPLLREALVTNPNNAEAHWELGYAYRYAGMLKESIEEGELARRIDPEVKLASSAFNSYFYDGQYEKFIKSLPEKEIAFIVFYRGLGHLYLKDEARAKEYFKRAYELEPLPSLYIQAGRALSYAIEDKRVEGIELLRNTEMRVMERGVSDAEGVYKVAQAYAVLGDPAGALRLLRVCIDQGFFCYPYFMNDPLLDSLRGEAEYNELMEKARARHEEFKKKFS